MVLMFALAACGGGRSESPPPQKVSSQARLIATIQHVDSLEENQPQETSGPKKIKHDSIIFQTLSDKLIDGLGLYDLKEYLTKHPEATLVRIGAHVSSFSNEPLEQKLSEKRALFAARWLVSAGIDCKRLLPVGFGAKHAQPERDPADSLQNRIESYVVARNGTPLDDHPEGDGTPAGDPCGSP